MTEDIYHIKLSDIFEGPMDLLVYLIKKNEVDIYDIPIALITDQYLQYLELMKFLNIDLAGEFIYMAATLTHIKSRMLLPVYETEDEQEDPRLELTKPLLEYLQMKSAADQLAERYLLGEDTFVRYAKKEEYLADGDDEVIQVGLFELIDAFQKILRNVSPDLALDFSAERMSVKDKISQLVDILESKGSVTFDELFLCQYDKGDIVVTFLAILEMVRLSLVRITQHLQSGIIRIFYL